ncbi:MAG: hypothetical protein AAGD96_28420 [Chloroflexota bacterium]
MPYHLLNGRGAFMHYWHAVYFLFATQQEKGTTLPMVITNSAELENLSGLGRRQVMKERAVGWDLPNPYSVREDEAEGGFALVAPYYRNLVNVHTQSIQREKIYLIPHGLVANGWLSFIWKRSSSRLCIAIVNQLLRQPAGRRFLDMQHLISACKDPERKTKPSRDQMDTALKFLLDVDLVRPVEIRGRTWYQLQTHQLDSPAGFPNDQDTNSEFWPPMVHLKFKQDPERTQKAVDCARVGQLDLEENFEQIYRDVGYLNWENEGQIFLRRLSHWRSDVDQPNKWQRFWTHYCKMRAEKDLRRFVSHRETIDLSQALNQSWSLSVSKFNVHQLMHAKLLVWLNLPNYLEEVESICTIQLSTEEQKKLWETYLSGGIPHLKRDLTKIYKAGHKLFLCQINSGQMWPDTDVSVQLEAVIYKRKKS